jgi:YidC/Oxa1 family membrane protein insertase
MDRKAIIVLVVSFVLLVLWFPLVNKLYPPAPYTGTNLVDTASATNSQGSVPGVSVPGATNLTERPPGQATLPATNEEPAGPEQTLVLENEQARYTFTSHGGGLKLVELKKYPAAIVCGDGAATNTALATLNARARQPVLALAASWAGRDHGYTLAQTSPASVRATKSLPGGLVVVKEFTLGADYQVAARVTFSNTTAQPLGLANYDIVTGTASPAGPKDDPTLMGIFVYDGVKKLNQPATWFDNRAMGCGPPNPREKFETGEMKIVWATAHNQFFALAAAPREPAGGLVSYRAELLPNGTNHTANGPAAAVTHGFENHLTYRGAVLDAGGVLTREFDLYAGPKELQTLTKLGAQQKNNLDYIMDLEGFFGFFSKLLLLAMNALHDWGLSYGWAIVAITVIIKLAFWPLTNASTKSMKRMAAVQPQMKELQEKYKDNPQKLNQKMMELWKEHKINPLGGCLPMLIQMPVFFGFFFMIRTAIELRGAEFLWICDLSTADSVFFIPGVNFPVNPMAILMAVTMVVQMRLTPMSPTMDPVQQKMMKWMPLMFVVFLYNFSSGLTLYWTVQNILSIVQTKLTKTDPPPAATPAKPVASSPKKAGRK